MVTYFDIRHSRLLDSCANGLSGRITTVMLVSCHPVSVDGPSAGYLLHLFCVTTMITRNPRISCDDGLHCWHGARLRLSLATCHQNELGVNRKSRDTADLWVGN